MHFVAETTGIVGVLFGPVGVAPPVVFSNIDSLRLVDIASRDIIVEADVADGYPSRPGIILARLTEANAYLVSIDDTTSDRYVGQAGRKTVVAGGIILALIVRPTP